jgi:hypothetical protein
VQQWRLPHFLLLKLAALARVLECPLIAINLLEATYNNLSLLGANWRDKCSHLASKSCGRNGIRKSVRMCRTFTLDSPGHDNTRSLGRTESICGHSDHHDSD